MSGSNRILRLQLFPVDVLDRISYFLNDDELFKLFRSGDRAFLARLRQISTVTAVWKSSALCGWNRFSTFLAAFPKMHTVILRVSSEFQVPSEPFNSDFLPLNLASISIEFYGALHCLIRKKPFEHFHSLTHLSISQHSAPACDPPKIDLTQFPKSLLRLRLHTGRSQAYSYLSTQLNELPPDLTALDLNLPTDTQVIQLGPSLSSLKHLTLKAPTFRSFGVDLTHVAANLESLEVPTPYFRGEYIRRITYDDGTPLRIIFPRLHTLVVTRSASLPWSMLETLPLSITKVGGHFNMSPDGIAAGLQACRNLNERHLSATGAASEACFAPLLVRHLVSFGREKLGAFFPYFSSLEELSAPLLEGSTEWKDLPRRIQAIEANRLSGPSALIPRSLTSISCDVLAIKEDNEVKRLESDRDAIDGVQVPIKLPHLVHLSVLSSRITHAIVSLLPETLRTLDVVIATPDVLEALTEKSGFEGDLPLLSSLRIKVPFLEPESRLGDLIISADTIPGCIKSLELAGDYKLVHPLSSNSLKSHPNLTSLKFASPEHPTAILPQLPKTLLRFSCLLSKPVDLHDEFMLYTVLNLPPSLRELRVSLHSSDSYKFNGWLILPTNRLPFWSILPHLQESSMGFRFRLLRALPAGWVREEALTQSAERYVHSRLPGVLSEFSAPFYDPRKHNLAKDYRPDHRAKDTPWQLVIEFITLTTPLEIFQRTLFTRLPLLGLLVPRQYYEDQDVVFRTPLYVPRISALPPRIQDLHSGEPELDRAYFDRTRDSSREAIRQANVRTPERVIARTMFQSLNLLAWLHLRYYLALDRHQHPLAWTFAWINLLGSAVTIPLQLFVHRKSLASLIPDPNYRPEGIDIIKNALPFLLAGLIVSIPSIGLLWSTNFATAVALDYAPSRWNSWYKAAAFGFATLSEVVIHVITSRILF